jgi:hypothetical protein
MDKKSKEGGKQLFDLNEEKILEEENKKSEVKKINSNEEKKHKNVKKETSACLKTPLNIHTQE